MHERSGQAAGIAGVLGLNWRRNVFSLARVSVWQHWNLPRVIHYGATTIGVMGDAPPAPVASKKLMY